MASTFDKIQWWPIWPTLYLPYLIYSTINNGPNVFRVISIVIIGAWFIGAWYNHFSKGKLLMFFDGIEDEDQEDFSLPASFSELARERPLSSDLQTAIEEGLENPDILKKVISNLEVDEITEFDDAVAICTALQENLNSPNTNWKTLSKLLQSPGSQEVYTLFYQQGLPLVHRIYQRETAQSKIDSPLEVLLLLKIIAMYGYEAGFSDLSRATQNSHLNDHFMWGSIFSNTNSNDPDIKKLIKKLSSPLPSDFSSIAFLDWMNEWCLEEKIKTHPFSSDEGIKRLEEYLSNPDSDYFSYANSAVVAIPFLKHKKVSSLLAMGRDHPDQNVRLEVAWASAKLKIPNGIRDLAMATGDWKTGASAVDYMRELGLNDEIPKEVLEDKFFEKCIMARWLAHPNELTKYPDSLDIIDHREIFWPATGKKEKQTLFLWKLDDDEGISWSGSSTWALFSSATKANPILDLYSMYNSWHMSANGLENAPESFSDLETGREILQTANPDEDWKAQP